MDEVEAVRWIVRFERPDDHALASLDRAGRFAALRAHAAAREAFAGGGAVFGLAYLAVVAMHAALFTRAASGGVVRALLRLAPFNLTSALLVLLAGALGGVAEYVVWVLALALMWLAGRVASTGGFGGFGGFGGPSTRRWSGSRCSACCSTPACGGRTSAATMGAPRAHWPRPRARRPALALIAFGYEHLPLLLGVIAVASALREATGHAFADLDVARAFALAGGVSLFLCGEALFRRSLGIGPGWWHAVMGALALAPIPLGIAVASVAQRAALVGLLVVGFAAAYAATTRGSGPSCGCRATGASASTRGPSRLRGRGRRPLPSP